MKKIEERIAGNLFVNGDCIETAPKYLADDTVDLIVTDPPYGIEGDRLHRHYNRDEQFVVNGYIEVPAPEYNRFTKAWLKEAQRVLRPGGSLYVISGYTNLFDVLDGLRSTALEPVNHCIWKYNFGVYTSRKFVSSHYHILYYAKPGGKRTFNLQSRFALDATAEEGGSLNYRDREDVWVIAREYKPGRAKNKNELPAELLAKILSYSSCEGDLVCDFFLGGGSTAAAAIGMNRQFAGFERSPQAFAHAISRIRMSTPGSLLASAPQPYSVPNRGKSWSSSDDDRLRRRFLDLQADGATKRAIVQQLSQEFARGSWSIRKRLRAL